MQQGNSIFLKKDREIDSDFVSVEHHWYQLYYFPELYRYQFDQEDSW